MDLLIYKFRLFFFNVRGSLGIRPRERERERERQERTRCFEGRNGLLKHLSFHALIASTLIRLLRLNLLSLCSPSSLGVCFREGCPSVPGIKWEISERERFKLSVSRWNSPPTRLMSQHLLRSIYSMKILPNRRFARWKVCARRALFSSTRIVAIKISRLVCFFVRWNPIDQRKRVGNELSELNSTATLRDVFNFLNWNYPDITR